MKPQPIVKSLHFHTVGRYGAQLSFPTAAPNHVSSLITLAEHAQRKGMASNEVVSLVTRTFHQRYPEGQPVEMDLNAQRFSFVMTLETEHGGGRKEVQVVSGYTEPATELHANLKLYFDRNTIFARDPYIPGGPEGKGNLHHRTELIKDTLIIYGEGEQSLNRVNEIFSSMQTRTLLDRMQGGHEILDIRSMFRHTPVKLVLGKDDSTYGYVNRALRTYEASMRDMNPMEEGEEGVAGNALAMLPNANLSVDPVFRELVNMTNFMNGHGSVAYHELISAFNIREQDVAIYVDAALTDHTHKGMNKEIESYIADQAIRAMASLMPTFNLTALNIVWSGGDIIVENAISHGVEWEIRTGVKGIMKPLKNHLKALTSTTPGGVKLDLRCKVNLYHDAEIEVKVNNRDPKIIVQPMWCAGRFSPQLTNNRDQGEVNSRFFSQLISTLNTHYVTKPVDME
jgi:hypothetical protein